MFHYLVSIDDYYVAVWAADSRDGVPELVQAMLRGIVVCFAFKRGSRANRAKNHVKKLTV
jgi:hypothetical protein